MDLKRILYKFIVRMMTSTILIFAWTFAGIFSMGLLFGIALSRLGITKEIDIAPVLIFSFLFALLAASVRTALVKKYSQIRI